eukprot:scaffold11529_cov108-Cylindrotheca_fusiformis.AAC.4
MDDACSGVVDYQFGAATLMVSFALHNLLLASNETESIFVVQGAFIHNNGGLNRSESPLSSKIRLHNAGSRL